MVEQNARNCKIMVVIPQYSVGFTLLAVAVLHFYWSFGGKIWSEAVIPTRTDEQKVVVPGFIATFVVATVFLCIALYFLLPEIGLNRFGTSWISWVVAGGFIVRGIGDFKYVGLFKQIRDTAFAKNDSKLFTPLVLILGFLTLMIAFQTLN